MFGFILASLSIGGMIAGYIMLPKDDMTKFVINTIKFIIFTMTLTLIGLFTLAMLGSTTSFKLF